jgi:hypothetical protein
MLRHKQVEESGEANGAGKVPARGWCTDDVVTRI